MVDDMGILHIEIELAPIEDHARRRNIADVMVDTGSEYTWAPAPLLHELGVKPVRMERFESADGRILEREIGFAIVFAAGRSTPTIVAFGEPGDMVLLGAIALEGLNMRVDLPRRALVPAGPIPVAAA